MVHPVPRVVAAALCGALAGAVCLVLIYVSRSQVVTFESALQPPIGIGFYPAEHNGEFTFNWTSPVASISLPGLDRRSAWSCSVEFSGARPDPAMPQPDLGVAVDGVTVAVRRATNDIQTIDVVAPARPRKPGLDLTLTSSTTFVPGRSDPRTLGVRVDGLACRPVGSWIVLPPFRALGYAALAAAVFGAVLGLTGMRLTNAAATTVVIAAAQAFPLSTGPAPYVAYPAMPWLAVGIAASTLVVLKVLEMSRATALPGAARFVVVFSAGALYLKLLALCHPAKPLVDALFHAHRLEWVLAGRYYFTQLSTSGTPFPYAIGLYLFAAPWSVLVHDHVLLLRIVVCSAEALAGALLYPMIVRTWNDRLAGAIAVVLFHFIPLSYAIIGNGNLTNAFGQSVAVVTVVAAAVWALGSRQVGQLIGLTALVTLGFISHISVVLLLLSALLAVAFFYRLLGGAALRAPARSVLLATAMGLLLAVVSYWGHFGGVYKAQLERARQGAVVSSSGAPGRTPPAAAANRAPAPGKPALSRVTLPLQTRAAEAFSQTTWNVGWPILVLAIVGAWRLWVRRARDRLVLVLAAWAVTCLGFVAVSVLAPGEMRYQQDAWEFIGRVEHVTLPAAVILAATGAAWAWRSGTVLRIVSGALLLAAAINGAQAWIGWLR